MIHKLKVGDNVVNKTHDYSGIITFLFEDGTGRCKVKTDFLVQVAQVEELYKIMKTKHCPKCDNDKLWYTIDIFKEKTDPNYYTGEIQCNICKQIFKKDKIKIRTWKEVY